MTPAHRSLARSFAMAVVALLACNPSEPAGSGAPLSNPAQGDTAPMKASLEHYRSTHHGEPSWNR
jgi:hypothetical protein